MLINKCPLLSAFILVRCDAGIPSGANKPVSVSTYPWVFKSTGQLNNMVDFPAIPWIFLLYPLNLNFILLTHFDCLNVWLKTFGIATDSIIDFALFDNLILFKVPFIENSIRSVLVFWVNATARTHIIVLQVGKSSHQLSRCK